MKNRIIEIVELGIPKSLIQRENEPTTELIETNLLVEEVNQALRLFAVVGRSELLLAFTEFVKKHNEVAETINHYDVEAFLSQQ